MIDVCLVGTGGTVPLPGRALASALVRIGGAMILFDCGEGTQVAMRAPGWGFAGLHTICLTHVHADHVAGLPGLLLTLGSAGRTAPLEIYGPRWTTEVVHALRILAPRLPYPVHVREVAGGASFSAASARVTTFALHHRAPCLGFRVDLARQPAFQPERARALAIPVHLWRRLQRGEAVEWAGGTAAPTDVLGPARRGLSVAYITDTRPVDGLPEFVRGVDLLICESAYLARGDEARAAEHDHLHLVETCRIAIDAGVQQLWLTHFSPAVPDARELTDEVAAQCPSATIGRDGMTISLAFPAS